MRTRLVALLRRTGDRLQVAGAPHGRYRSYHEAAHALEHLAGDLERLASSCRLFQLLPVRTEVRRVIEDFVDGREPTIPQVTGDGSSDLANLEGVPLRHLEAIRRRLGIRAIKDLADAHRAGELDKLDWLPPAVVRRIGHALAPREGPARWPLGEALPAARRLVGALRGMVAPDLLATTGRLRRATEWIDGIYVLAAPPEAEELHGAFAVLPGLSAAERVAPDVSRGRADEGPPVELRTTSAAAFPSLLQFHTGSPEHTKQLRQVARERGLSLRQDRLTGPSGRLQPATETELYGLLGLAFVPPELRRGRGEVQRARSGPLPHLVKLCHCAGDFHVHSDFSDGLSNLEQLAEAAAGAGHRFLAVCDHSRSLTFAHGLTVERLHHKRTMVERFNARGGPVRLLCGAEVDILPDGSLDYPDDVLSSLDLVIGAIHLNLTDPPAVMTRRMVTAISTGRMHVLAHATTRILGMRPARSFDVDAVLAQCRDRGVALEINGHAHRMDPPLPIIERALELGVPLALGSDAHHLSQLWMLELALLQARRAGAVHDAVMNTWDFPRLDAWLRHRPIS